MKIAALILFPILTFAAEPSLRTQQEAQVIFDAAFSSADKMVISAISISPATESRKVSISYVPVWETTEVSNISPLSQCFRLQFEPPTKRVVGGKEILEIRDVSYFGHPSFSVTLKKKEQVLLLFYARQSSISCETFLQAAGRVYVDPVAYAPFYSRIMELTKSKKANH